MNQLPAAVSRQPYPLKSRVLTVLRTENLSPDMRRIFLGGDDLEATLPIGPLAPTDHVKLAIPDAATGEVALPTFGDVGMNRPEGVALREYTIRSFNAERRELAIDFVLHEHGPAGRWASSAAPGDSLGVIGPRGTQLYPTSYDRYLLAADETALPAAERWIEEAPDSATVDLLVLVENAASERELPRHPGLTLTWLHRSAGGDLAAAVQKAMPSLEASTFVWAAAEAMSLVPIRRYLRELGHDRRSTDVRGYWKTGEAEHREAPDAEESVGNVAAPENVTSAEAVLATEGSGAAQ